MCLKIEGNETYPTRNKYPSLSTPGSQTQCQFVSLCCLLISHYQPPVSCGSAQVPPAPHTRDDQLRLTGATPDHPGKMSEDLALTSYITRQNLLILLGYLIFLRWSGLERLTICWRGCGRPLVAAPGWASPFYRP